MNALVVHMRNIIKICMVKDKQLNKHIREKCKAPKPCFNIVLVNYQLRVYNDNEYK